MSIDATQDFIDEVKGCIRKNTIVNGDGTIDLSPIYDEIDTVKDSLNAHTSDDDVHTTIPEAAAIFSNPNLLIDPDFSINQRGKTEYTEAGYTVDGWKINANVKLDSSQRTLTVLDTTKGAEFVQIIEKDFTDLAGKEVTTSCKMGSEVYKATGTVANDEYASTSMIARSIIPATNGQFHFGISYSAVSKRFYVNIWIPANSGIETLELPKWTKLELGSVATPFVPPDPATELAKCQRYFERVQIPVNNRLTAYMFTDTSSCSYNIEYKPKRTVPTIVKPEYNGRFVEQYNQRVVVLTSFDIESLTTTNVSIHAAFAAALDSKSVGWVDSLGYVDVSAEL